MGNKQSINLPILEYTLDELKYKIKPFDLIFFRGGDFISDIIANVQNKSFGNGEWTHVGLVLTRDILKFKGKKNNIYVWESTMSGKMGDGVNNIYNKGHFGVQIRDLDSVIEGYLKVKKTKIGWCKLINNPFDKKENESDILYQKRISNIKKIIKNFYYKNKNSSYDYTLKTFLKTIFPRLSKIKFINKILHTDNKYFCSELVAEIYKQINVLDETIDPENIAPIELLGYSNDGIGKIVDEPLLLCRKNKYKKYK
jgi:hypothetical protein